MEQISRNLTNSELAILGLIVERERHGYEIEAVIQDRGMRNWTEIGFSSIYHVLGSLERRGLIASRSEPAPGRGPARKVFQASAEGQSRYRSEALGALSLVQRAYPPFLQGLAALPLLDPAAVAEALASYRGSLAARLEEIDDKDLPGLPAHVAAMFSYARTLIRAEADWVSVFEARIRTAIAEGERA